jgi:hypothetical protein
VVNATPWHLYSGNKHISFVHTHTHTQTVGPVSSVDQSTRRHVPQDQNLLRSYMFVKQQSECYDSGQIQGCAADGGCLDMSVSVKGCGFPQLGFIFQRQTKRRVGFN